MSEYTWSQSLNDSWDIIKTRFGEATSKAQAWIAEQGGVGHMLKNAWSRVTGALSSLFESAGNLFGGTARTAHGNVSEPAREVANDARSVGNHERARSAADEVLIPDGRSYVADAPTVGSTTRPKPQKTR